VGELSGLDQPGNPGRLHDQPEVKVGVGLVGDYSDCLLDHHLEHELGLAWRAIEGVSTPGSRQFAAGVELEVNAGYGDAIIVIAGKTPASYRMGYLDFF
jgi:hypothetical protein